MSEENIPIRMTKSNIEFTSSKGNTEPDIDETKEIIRYQLAEKQKSLYEQLRINEEIKQAEFEERFKPSK